METQERERLLASLMRQAGPNADATKIAEATVAILRAINDVLCPVIGRGGAAALQQRGIYLSQSDHPWLAAIMEPGQTPGDLSALSAILARQSCEDAKAGGIALLQTFGDLLIKLIGKPLTEQLFWAGVNTLAPSSSG